jgi:Flp pilus assembly protein TadD
LIKDTIMPSQNGRLIRALSASVFTLSLAACHPGSLDSSSEDNRPSLKAARTALAEGEAETALGIAKGVLSQEPKNVAALVQAGNAEAALGNHVTAEHDFRLATQYNPSYTPARLGMAKLKLHEDPKAAEAEFRAILAGTPHDAATLTDLGVALDLQERHKEAQAEYTAALAANPDLTSARVNMGLSLALSGDPMKAEQMLRDATESGPVPPKVRADFAVAEVVAGHSDDAQQTLQADLSPDEAKASVEGMQALVPAAK